MTAKLDPDHQAAVWAVRYCLGRMTHVVGSCVEWLIWAWPDLNQDARSTIKRDIEEAFAEDDRDREKANGASGYKRLGMDMDRREWERVRKLWIAMIPNDYARCNDVTCLLRDACARWTDRAEGRVQATFRRGLLPCCSFLPIRTSEPDPAQGRLF